MCTGEQGHRERGGRGRGYNDPGAHGLWGAHGLQEGSKGAHQMTFRNEHVRPSFWRPPDFDQKKKNVRIPLKNFFFLEITS